jgi:hypothetical protein
MKRTPHIDQETGEYNLKYNMQNMLEDFYIPIRGNDTATKIDTTPGLQYDGIADVEYLREKLFAALKVPKAFMGYDENTDGKATLAAQDIRFARTIERIQRIIVSELQKIALVHLYTQGYTDESLSNFELSMTTPSIIYDQERVALMTEKMTLAQSMIDSKIIPTDWIYENIFHFSQDEFDEYRDLVQQDQKRNFRLAQIEAEGNDPLETGKSYGTPHDLASLYGMGRTQSDPGNVPDGYNEKTPLGRPKEKLTDRGTQDNAFGKDPIGREAAKGGNDTESSRLRPKFKGGSPLAMEHKNMLKKVPGPQRTGKQLVFEQEKKGNNLLDENQLK